MEKTASGHSGHGDIVDSLDRNPHLHVPLHLFRHLAGPSCGEHASSECPWKPMTGQVKHSRCETHGDTLGIPAILTILAQKSQKIRLDEHG